MDSQRRKGFKDWWNENIVGKPINPFEAALQAWNYQDAELTRMEQALERSESAHRELHRYNETIGLRDCELCEAIERIAEGGALTRAKGEQP